MKFALNQNNIVKKGIPWSNESERGGFVPQQAESTDFLAYSTYVATQRNMSVRSASGEKVLKIYNAKASSGLNINKDLCVYFIPCSCILFPHKKIGDSKRRRIYQKLQLL